MTDISFSTHKNVIQRAWECREIAQTILVFIPLWDLPTLVVIGGTISQLARYRLALGTTITKCIFNQRRTVEELELLQQYEFVGRSVRDIANFLYDGAQLGILDRVSIGDYLVCGQHPPATAIEVTKLLGNDKVTEDILDQGILEAVAATSDSQHRYAYQWKRDHPSWPMIMSFLYNFDFSEDTIVEALRKTIDLACPENRDYYTHYYLKRIAESYWLCLRKHGSPLLAALRNHVDVYMLLYTVFLLNTDMTNHAIREKMAREEFVQMTHGIPDLQDIPVHILYDIYDQLRKEPLKLSNTKHVDLRPARARARTMREFFVRALRTLSS